MRAAHALSVAQTKPESFGHIFIGDIALCRNDAFCDARFLIECGLHKSLLRDFSLRARFRYGGRIVGVYLGYTRAACK